MHTLSNKFIIGGRSYVETPADTDDLRLTAGGVGEFEFCETEFLRLAFELLRGGAAGGAANIMGKKAIHNNQFSQFNG